MRQLVAAAQKRRTARSGEVLAREAFVLAGANAETIASFVGDVIVGVRNERERGRILIWSDLRGAPNEVGTTPAHAYEVVPSPRDDGAQIWYANNSELLMVDVPSGHVHTIAKRRDDIGFAIFSPDGQRLVIGPEEGAPVVYDGEGKLTTKLAGAWKSYGPSFWDARGLHLELLSANESRYAVLRPDASSPEAEPFPTGRSRDGRYGARPTADGFAVTGPGANYRVVLGKEDQIEPKFYARNAPRYFGPHGIQLWLRSGYTVLDLPTGDFAYLFPDSGYQLESVAMSGERVLAYDAVGRIVVMTVRRAKPH